MFTIQTALLFNSNLNYSWLLQNKNHSGTNEMRFITILLASFAGARARKMDIIKMANFVTEPSSASI